MNPDDARTSQRSTRLAEETRVPHAPRRHTDDWSTLEIDAGQCSGCAHAQVNVTRRGPAYLRCLRAGWDPRLPRYPRLPVMGCVGFEPRPQQ